MICPVGLRLQLVVHWRSDADRFVSDCSSILDICWMDRLVFLEALHLQMLLCSNNNTVISRPFWGDHESVQAPNPDFVMCIELNGTMLADAQKDLDIFVSHLASTLLRMDPK